MRRHILTLIGPFLVMGAAVLAGAGAGGQEAPTSPRPSYPETRAPLPPSHPHVPELAGFLERLEIHKPQIYGELGIFALTRRKGAALRGRWSTMDEAIESRFLVVTEQKSGATVPVIYMENRSPDHHVFVMGGEVVSGGKQTRTIRRDIVLAPGQKLDIGAFCVEAGRWHGNEKFESSP